MIAKQLNTQIPGWYRFRIGALECTTIWDGYIHHGYQDLFPNADPAELARLKHEYRLPKGDFFPMDLNPVVVNTGDKLILIDAGMGQTSQLFGDTMGHTIANMKASGIDPDDIDAVLMTHLHPDHSFGLIHPDGSAVYRNADLYVSEPDWAEWTDEASLKRNDFRAPWTEGTLAAVAPYRDRVKLFKLGDTILSGVKTMSVAGHSLGQCAFIFESEGEKVVFTGDAAHHHIFDPVHPEWFFHMVYDSDPQMGADAKAAIFARVVDENIRYHGYHFPYPGLGDMERVEDGTYRFHGEPVSPRYNYKAE
jgi:glyoxylase-like metal-dependent hydrolase (beta-lactamase superfamily II)